MAAKRDLLLGFIGLVMAGAQPAVADGQRQPWAGVYIGASAGGAWTSIDWDYYNLPGQSLTRDQNGAVGGIHAGLQTQWNQLVLGVEFSYQRSLGGKMESRGPDAPIFAPAYDSYASIDDFVTIGPRIGWAVSDQLLVYGTGGYANARVETSFFLKGTSPEQGNFRIARHDGWFIGGGADYALTRNWLIGVEYRHMDLDTELIGIPPSTGASRYIAPTVDSVSARLSYKLGVD